MDTSVVFMSSARSLMATLFVLLVALNASVEGTRAASRLQEDCTVSLPAGDMQGRDTGTSCAFLGVPYAASPAGDNRWTPPKPRPSWAPAVMEANTAVPQCPQVQMPQGTLQGVEDCLFLNVWTRDTTGSAPVLVWFHTGAFTGASANFAGTNGQRLAETHGIVVVAPNYRVGPLGFLAHRALASEHPAHSVSGNYGLLDQRAALEWVRDNIARFGGDPGNVTIAGTSAGGTSVGLHLVSPGSAGLFHRAVLQSAYLATMRLNTAEESFAAGDAWATAIHCTDEEQILACMRAKPLSQVLTALPVGTLQVAELANRVYWEPIVDGVVVPDQPRLLFEQGRFERVPSLIGFNRDEGWGSFITRSFATGVTAAQYENWVSNEFGLDATGILALYPASSFSAPAEAMARVVGDAQFVCEARRLARLTERTGTPTYVYAYEYEIDALSLDHVPHGVEANILFGNHYVPPVFQSHTLTTDDVALHTSMAGYWTRFVATGNPNRGDHAATSWPPFKRPNGSGRGNDKFIVFRSAIGEETRMPERRCDFFDQTFYRSLLGGLPAGPQ